MSFPESKLGLIFAKFSIIASLLIVLGQIACRGACDMSLVLFNFPFVVLYKYFFAAVFTGPLVYPLTAISIIVYACGFYAVGMVIEGIMQNHRKFVGNQVLDYLVLTLVPEAFYIGAITLITPYINDALCGGIDAVCGEGAQVLYMFIFLSITFVYWIVAFGYIYAQMDGLRVLTGRLIVPMAVVTIVISELIALASGNYWLPVVVYPLSFIGYYIFLERIMLRI